MYDVNGMDLVQTLSNLSLFADLSNPELQAVAHTFEEELFPQGQRVLRQGFSGAGFYVILEGEASVSIDGEERSRLGRGDFFGEISVLLDEPPTADVTAITPLRCLVLPGPDLTEWLVERPWVTLRMLQAEIRRLRAANRWQS
jgi:CRP-like cAMP-binding protein